MVTFQQPGFVYQPQQQQQQLLQQQQQQFRLVQQQQQQQQFPQQFQAQQPVQFPMGNALNAQFQPSVVQQQPRLVQTFVAQQQQPPQLQRAQQPQQQQVQQQIVPAQPSARVLTQVKPAAGTGETRPVFEQQFKIQKLTPEEMFAAQQNDLRLQAKQRIRAPPPPERFIPHLADIYGEPIPDRPYTPPESVHTTESPPTSDVITIESTVIKGPPVKLRVPAPPRRFIPHLSDIYGNPMPDPPDLSSKSNLSIEAIPSEAYGSNEKLVDATHQIYIENTAKTNPTDQFGRIVQPNTIPRPRVISNSQFKASFICKFLLYLPHHRFKTPEIGAGTIRRPVLVRPRPVQVKPRVKITTPPPAVIQVVTEAAAAAPVSLGKTPNDVFLGCCKKVGVAKSCERICNFDVLSKKTITGMFLGTDPCPQSYGLDLLQCAAQSGDHTDCCRTRGVHTTTAGRRVDVAVLGSAERHQEMLQGQH
ncbi:unnamed protein product [Nippostrongylus brasiliensis]|uniref:DB domain-containing protein n=1 Tax=Nippostrongylus brasiliensis TaxID=27835 RepID=A0A158R078_NIPBR|nr:unnamed protein product [Nippostrongylus brasiliensis]